MRGRGPKTTLAWVYRGMLYALAVYGALALTGLALVPRFFLPAEDAVILFQYSHNLVRHGAITYLAGGPRTEGATDFGWMALLALADRCGLPAFACAAFANVLSLVCIAVLLLKLAGSRPTIVRVLAIAGGAALFPQIFSAAAGFSVLPNALLLTALVYFATRNEVAKASISALALCLFRPDGVIFAFPLLGWLLSRTRNRRDMVSCLLLFVVPGLAYFFWRWHYFGELLPLPFLVKSDARRVLGLVVEHSVRSSLVYLALAAMVLYPLRKIDNGSGRVLALILIVVPTLFYWSLRLDQNVGDRFYFYIPLATAILTAVYWPHLLNRGYVLRAAFLGWIVFLAMPWWRELRTFRDMQFREVKSIAEELATLTHQGTIATSEAGFLPYYSGWRTVDVWGLNNAKFAHRFFQPSDLAAIQPDLVVLHPDRGESCLVQPDWLSYYPDRSWPHLSRNLVIGANSLQYELWLTSYGSEYYRRRKRWSYGEGDRECWFLRRNSALYEQLVGVLQAHHAVGPEWARHLEEAHLSPSIGGKLKP